MQRAGGDEELGEGSGPGASEVDRLIADEVAAVDDDDKDRVEPSLVSQLTDHPSSVVRCAGYTLVLGLFCVLAGGGGIIYYGVREWDKGCDQPLKWFWVLFGAVFCFQGLIVFAQVAVDHTHEHSRYITSFSHLPALGEIVLLGLGTYWATEADNCNVTVRAATIKLLIVLWVFVVLGAAQKLFKRCSDTPVPTQRWKH